MKKKLKSYFLPLVLLAVICGGMHCFFLPSGDEQRLEQALQLAKANRPELEKVLEHYKDDKEKWEAARFLIENMPGHFGYEGDDVDSLQAALKQYAAHWSYDRKRFGYLESFPYDRQRKMADIEHVQAEYLIENIEYSFKVWKEKSWAGRLSREEFYEYILPYRIGNERLTRWKKELYHRLSPVMDSLYAGDDPIGACDSLYGYISKTGGWKYCDKPSGADMEALFLAEERVGDCRAQAAYTAFVMRAVGIPVGIDSYLYSVELGRPHCWNVVLGADGKAVPFSLGEIRPKPDGRIFRKVGKAYRNTFAIQMDKLHKLGGAYPPTLRNVRLKDVTDTYCLPNRVEIACSGMDEADTDAVFLGTFSINGWVAIGEAEECRNGTAVFRNVEPDVVYVPLCLKAGRLQPSGSPFRVERETREVVSYELSGKETMRLTRKYPLTIGINGYMKRMTNGRFEAANKADFSDATVLYQLGVKEWPRRVMNEHLTDSTHSFRYVRYISADKYPGDIAEVGWFGTAGRRLEGKLMSTPAYNGLPDCAPANALDGDPLTYFSSDTFPGWVGMDLGRQERICRITFSPRNDDNFIREGEEYELFYLSSRGWESMGRQWGTSSTELVYPDVPGNGVYWLRNLTKGREEQLFTYENGRQCFNYERGRF